MERLNIHFKFTNSVQVGISRGTILRKKHELSVNYGIYQENFHRPTLGYAFAARNNIQVCESLCKILSEIMSLLVLCDLRCIADAIMSAVVAYTVPKTVEKCVCLSGSWM